MAVKFLKENNKATCVVCGKQYKICKNCDRNKYHGALNWRASCDTIECYQTLLVLTEFNYKAMSKAEARAHLDGLLTDEMLPYADPARGLIEKIYAEDIVFAPVEAVADEPAEVVAETPDAEIKEIPAVYEEVAAEIPVVEMPEEIIQAETTVEEAVSETMPTFIIEPLGELQAEDTSVSDNIEVPLDASVENAVVSIEELCLDDPSEE